MKEQFEWEVLVNHHDSPSGGFNTLRAKVFGGWVLKHMCWCNENNVQSESSVFIPDPNHEWEFSDDNTQPISLEKEKVKNDDISELYKLSGSLHSLVKHFNKISWEEIEKL